MSSISASEIAIYDRQIRIWGVATQQRIRTSCICLFNLSLLGVEVAKNLVLAGIGRLVIADAHEVQEKDLFGNYLVQGASGNRAVAAREKLALLNPNVEVLVEDLGTGKREDYEMILRKWSFNAVLLCEESADLAVRLDNICRMMQNNTPFFYGVSFGLSAVFFADFNQHEYKAYAFLRIFCVKKNCAQRQG